MENDWVVLLTFVGLTLMGMFGIAWRFRARAARRLLAALEFHAQREMAQERPQTISVSGKVRHRPGSSKDALDRGEEARRKPAARFSAPPLPADLRARKRRSVSSFRGLKGE